MSDQYTPYLDPSVDLYALAESFVLKRFGTDDDV